MAIWHTPPALLTASLQSSESFLWLRPTTESIACLLASAAACMASPRSFTISRPSSKDTTPAAHKAVYSPSEKPAMAAALFTHSASRERSCSRAAKPATNMAGWQYLVSSSFSSGPSSQSASTSHPRILLAFSSSSCTAGRSLTPAIIFTYCEPCPGKRSPTGRGSSAFGPTSLGIGSLIFSPVSQLWVVFHTSASMRFIMALSCFDGPTSCHSVTPSLMASFIDDIQSTGFVSCLFNRSTIALGSQPGRMGSPEAFIHKECRGACILGRACSSASAN
mmetsp:Transcript_10470/g.24620  ORF Transcript_10470/g.24620 Transcript_10470/m.24620 type:complete len:278 (-) Transcript_10470:88-921(-)